MLEADYSSSNLLGSSEEKQSEFVREILKSWDKHSEEIDLIVFVWLHDISQDKLEEYSEYMGVLKNNFWLTWER